MNYLNYFFNPAHLFSLRPEAMHARAVIILAVIFGLTVVLAGINKILLGKTKDGLRIKGLRRITHLCLTVGILGFVYLFFAWQGVALLASRIWLIIIFLTAVIWLAFIAKYLFLEVPKLRKEIDHRRDFERYLP
ncbi:MAG: hypothetical protein WCX08_05040 [Candidatus Buchananbacteria bacterium]